MSKSERSARLIRIGLTVVAGLLVLGVIFRGLLFGEVLLQADLIQLFEPLREVFAAEARNGNVSWTRTIAGGSALLGNPLHGVAYPPNWLCVIVTPARALSILCALHVAWGAVGAWFLAKERGARAVGAWTAASSFALCGVALSAALMPNLGYPLAWLPWLLIAHGRLRRKQRSWRPVLALALVLAVLLILAEPTLLFGGLLWIAIAELRPLIRSRGRRIPIRTAAAGALALLIALPALWPMLRTVGDSVRADGFTKEGLLQWSLHPAEPLAFVAPGLFGDPELYGLEGHWASGLWPARSNALYHGTYWGTPVLCLALAGALARGRRRAELLVWLTLLGLLALGRHGPIFPWLHELPLASSWRYPAKWLTPMSLPVALLAARGIESLSRRASQRALAVGASLLALTCLVLALGPSSAMWSALGAGGEEPPWLDDRIAVSGLLGLVPLLLGAAMLIGACKLDRLARVGLPLACLLTLDLLVANAGLVPWVPLSLYRDEPAALRLVGEATDGQRIWIEPARDLEWTRRPRTRAEYHRWERDALRLYTPVAFGREQAFPVDFEAMSPSSLATLTQLIQTAPPREKLLLLGAAGVTHLFTFEELDPRWATPLGAQDVGTRRPLRAYRNELALPRARVVGELVPFVDREEWYRLVAQAADDAFAHSALVARSDLKEPPEPVAAPSLLVEATWMGSSSRFTVRGDGGWLIVAEPLVEGCRAERNGEPAQLLRADIAFRGLLLGRGEHEIAIRCPPW